MLRCPADRSHRPHTAGHALSDRSGTDILTSISGVDWATGWAGKILLTIDGIEIAVLGKNEFVANKRASGRPRDLADLAMLDDADAGPAGD